MQEIVNELVKATVSELIAIFKKSGGQTFRALTELTQNAVNSLGSKFLEKMCASVDEEFNALRDKHVIVQKHKEKTRRLMSEMGEITLRRRFYYDKAERWHFYAVDDILKIEPYTRIESNLQSKLIKDATITSYGKSSSINGGKVSRQTVFNLVKRTELKNTMFSESKHRKVNRLFIEADEDHIHLQNGKSAEVKLVYVHEGSEKVCKGRKQLKNARYFVSAVESPDKLWNDVSKYVYDHYLYDELHISGDGAAWIKQGIEWLSKAIYHLDRFHVYKNITNTSYGDKEIRHKMLSSIRERNETQLMQLFDVQYRAKTARSERQMIKQVKDYLDNNFLHIDLTGDIGCAAESHVSHVLSARMSSRPMGWSRQGAERIAQLRAFMFNGGDFSTLCRKRKIKSPNKVAKRYNTHISVSDTDNRYPIAFVNDKLCRQTLQKLAKI